MEPLPRSRMIEDWSVLKYGWLAVFLVHVAFLAMGVYYIKASLDMFDPELIKSTARRLDLTIQSVYIFEQRRMDLVIQATYMVTVAFSIIMLIIAVFVLEIFRNQRRLMHQLDEIIALQNRPAGVTPATSGSGPSPG